MPASMRFEIDELAARLAEKHGSSYLEFLRVPDLSAGLYELKAGQCDTQSPHDEDEIYVVIAGRADFRVGDDSAPIMAGSVLYVSAGIDHRFENIVEDLKVLVVFAAAHERRSAGGTAVS